MFKLLKKMFSNEVCREEKPVWKILLFFIIGLIIVIIIPVLFVYLEAWEITINLERLIWESENRFRFPYFIIFILSNLTFIIVAMLSIFKIDFYVDSKNFISQTHSDSEALKAMKAKRVYRIIMLILYASTTTLYIIALFN